MKEICPTAYFVLAFSYLLISCTDNKKPDEMKSQLVSVTTEVKGSDFFMPPPLSANELAKTLAEWLTNLSLLCDTIAKKKSVYLNYFVLRIKVMPSIWLWPCILETTVIHSITYRVLGIQLNFPK